MFVWLGPGRVGLMPNALSGEPRGTEQSRFRCIESLHGSIEKSRKAQTDRRVLNQSPGYQHAVR